VYNKSDLNTDAMQPCRVPWLEKRPLLANESVKSLFYVPIMKLDYYHNVLEYLYQLPHAYFLKSGNELI